MANPFRKAVIAGLKPGDTFSWQRTFTRDQTLAFGDLTMDYNPVHYDTRWSESKGFEDLICHGLLVGSMICEFGGQVGWLATGMTFKFIRPVYFDDTIRCTITLEQIEKNGRAKAQARFSNQHGDQVGYAEMTGRLPLDNDRQILLQMIEEGDPDNKLSNETYE